MSTVHCNTVQTSSGGAVTLTKQKAAKHFVFYVGQGASTIENSFNTISVTDVGTGDYKPFLTNAMSTTFSILKMECYRTSRTTGTGGGTSMVSTTAYEMDITNSAGTTFTDSEVGASLLGDLA